jgi:hypothetical protein
MNIIERRGKGSIFVWEGGLLDGALGLRLKSEKLLIIGSRGG